MGERGEHRWVVDGIEEGMVRIEEDGERFVVVPRYLLPVGVAEGQVLRVSRGAEKQGSVTITVSIDVEGTAQALAESKAKTARTMAASRKRDPGGDVAL